jgi:hypothetical protein
MSYLIFSDFKKQIQTDNLNQIIGNDIGVLQTAELQAVEEAFGYLSQKYDTSQEFTNTDVWSPSVIYKAGDRVYLDAPAYSATATYALNALCLQSGKVYICTLAVNAPEAFDPSNWTLLGEQYDIFYAKYPHPIFNYESIYKKTDPVFWKNNTYVCQRASFTWGDDIQFRVYENIPFPNIFPDDPKNGVTFWGQPTAYAVTLGTLPTNTASWVAGDNRTQSVLMAVIDITLYHLHSRIAPRNIPDLRRDRYMNAVDMLRAFSRGEMTAKLPLIQPKRGARVRYGGSIKNINSY